MTRIDQLTMSLCNKRLLVYIDCVEVTKDQLETIVDDWLILDEGQFNQYPDATTLYVRKFHLNAIRFFSSSKKIEHDRLECVCDIPGGYHRYYVKEQKNIEAHKRGLRDALSMYDDAMYNISILHKADDVLTSEQTTALETLERIVYQTFMLTKEQIEKEN